MNEYDFAEKLAFSRGVAENTHPETIRALIGDSCECVAEPSVELNKKGIDFVATLRRGAELNIDVKTREKGCSRYWKSINGKREPELALETWSVIKTGIREGSVGWTLDESKLTDYTLHVFDHSDTSEVFLLPFQLLRMAFRKSLSEWLNTCRRAKQSSGTWESECVFVPAWRVVDAIVAEMRPMVSTTAP